MLAEKRLMTRLFYGGEREERERERVTVGELVWGRPRVRRVEMLRKTFLGNPGRLIIRKFEWSRMTLLRSPQRVANALRTRQISENQVDESE